LSEAFHDAMEAVLSGDVAALDPWLGPGDRARAGLAVYRNTVAKGRVDALACVFPTVARLVGADWFREAALIFAAAAPPDTPVLDAYGADFPDWLAAFPPAQEMTYLAPVARLDLAWSRAHRAVDEPVLIADAVAGIPPQALLMSRARLHPSLQMFWFDRTAPSIWLANRNGPEPDEVVVWRDAPEGLLIVRPALAVTWRRLSRPEWAFLDACRAGRTLGQAAAAALGVDPAVSLSQMFAAFLGAGVFTRLSPEPAFP